MEKPISSERRQMGQVNDKRRQTSMQFEGEM